MPVGSSGFPAGLPRQQAAAGAGAGAALGEGGAAQERARAVVAVAVPVVETVEDAKDGADAPLAGPGERAKGVVDAEAHGGVNVGLGGDAAGEGVGGEVGEHRDGPGDDEARGVLDDVDVQAGSLEQSGCLGQGEGRASVGRGNRDGGCGGGGEDPGDDDDGGPGGGRGGGGGAAGLEAAVRRGGGRGGGGGGRPFGQVDAAAGLAAEPAGLDDCPLGGGGREPRVVAESVPHRAGHGLVDVVADEVHESERSHAEAACSRQYGVDVLRNGGMLLVDPPCFGVVGAGDPVDDESWCCGGPDDGLAPCGGQVRGGVGG